MRAWITDCPLDVAGLLESIRENGHGAAVLFVGTVRDLNEGRVVLGIRYEAYREMAEPLLVQIVTEAEEMTGPCAIAAVHRIGDLDVGEASVAVAVSTPHRAQAFTAARYIIEEIKKRLPVWKHERYVEGEGEWLKGVSPQAGARHE
ncbi:MAG: molybdenum cofactor biosynthesis protein MoaE [Longimicrobiales bacterium]